MSEECKGKIHKLNSGTIYEGDWMTAPLAGGYDMAEVDGPYGLRKAAWDMVNIEGLAAWYRPHLARLTSLMAPSATVYLWNTAEGWARLDPEMRALGWEFRVLIVWNKKKSPESIGHTALTKWIDITEVCAFYTRGSPFYSGGPGAFNIWSELLAEFHGERLLTGDTKKRKAEGPNENVPLHPCQKPLLFAERMVQASTRPGMRVLIPFGGTCRIATYLERLKRNEPENARYYDCCELNADGKDYLGAVLGRMGEDAAAKAGQLSLFGGKR